MGICYFKDFHYSGMIQCSECGEKKEVGGRRPKPSMLMREERESSSNFERSCELSEEKKGGDH